LQRCAFQGETTFRGTSGKEKFVTGGRDLKVDWKPAPGCNGEKRGRASELKNRGWSQCTPRDVDGKRRGAKGRFQYLKKGTGRPTDREYD